METQLFRVFFCWLGIFVGWKRVEKSVVLPLLRFFVCAYRFQKMAFMWGIGYGVKI